MPPGLMKVGRKMYSTDCRTQIHFKRCRHTSAALFHPKSAPTFTRSHQISSSNYHVTATEHRHAHLVYFLLQGSFSSAHPASNLGQLWCWWDGYGEHQQWWVWWFLPSIPVSRRLGGGLWWWLFCGIKWWFVSVCVSSSRQQRRLPTCRHLCFSKQLM